MEQDFNIAGIEVLETIGAPVFMHQVKPEILVELEKDHLKNQFCRALNDDWKKKITKKKKGILNFWY